MKMELKLQKSAHMVGRKKGMPSDAVITFTIFFFWDFFLLILDVSLEFFCFVVFCFKSLQ